MGSAATPRHTLRRIVSDTGPLLHLSEAQALQILSYAGEIHIPKAVEIEMKLLDSRWRTPSWITVDPLAAAAEIRQAHHITRALEVTEYARSGDHNVSKIF